MKGLYYISIVIVVVVFSLIPTVAQDTSSSSSIILSEANINDLLRSGQQQDGNDFFLDFQPGQIVVNLVVTGEQGNITEFGLTLVPFVSPQKTLEFDATLLTINEIEIPINNNSVVDDITQSVGDSIVQETRDGAIESVVVSNDQVRLTWINDDPNAPTLSIVDDLWSLTFTEASINAMDWVITPTGPNVSDLSIDLQQGQVVITVNRTIEPTTVNYVVIPTAVNDRVAWQVDIQSDFEASVANTLSTVWRAYFTGIYGEGSMKNAIVTDNTITFTWDIDALENAERDNTVVTYTVNEAEMNAVLAEFTTSNLLAISVDIQPERVILNAVGIDQQGNQYIGAISLLPNLTNGNLNWTLEALSVNGIVLEGNAVSTGNNVTRMMTNGVNGVGHNPVVTNYSLSDTEMTITVQYP